MYAPWLLGACVLHACMHNGGCKVESTSADCFGSVLPARREQEQGYELVVVDGSRIPGMAFRCLVRNAIQWRNAIVRTMQGSGFGSKSID